jgi:hypothetical protein
MASPFFIHVGVKVKRFSLGQGDHVAIVYSGPPHPVEGRLALSPRVRRNKAAVFETPSKGLEARADRMERSRSLHLLRRDLSDLDFDVSIREADR